MVDEEGGDLEPYPWRKARSLQRRREEPVSPKHSYPVGK